MCSSTVAMVAPQKQPLIFGTHHSAGADQPPITETDIEALHAEAK